MCLLVEHGLSFKVGQYSRYICRKYQSVFVGGNNFAKHPISCFLQCFLPLAQIVDLPFPTNGSLAGAFCAYPRPGDLDAQIISRDWCLTAAFAASRDASRIRGAEFGPCKIVVLLRCLHNVCQIGDGWISPPRKTHSLKISLSYPPSTRKIVGLKGRFRPHSGRASVKTDNRRHRLPVSNNTRL